MSPLYSPYTHAHTITNYESQHAQARKKKTNFMQQAVINSWQVQNR